jgi:cardiolipin synthase
MKKGGFSITSQNKVDLLYDGAEYDDFFVQLIRSAEYSIHLQVYIFDVDDYGKLVFDELLNARKRGVELYILVDAIGSDKLTPEHVEKLRTAGAHFTRFNGIVIEKLLRWGRRLHHKILLIDQVKAIVGGINIVSPYVDSNFKAPRLDFAVYLEGPITKDLTNYCEKLFLKTYGSIQFEASRWPLTYSEGLDAKVSVNDWILRRIQISRDYKDLVRNAKDRITIINSYFFPRRSFMKLLADASKRGVKVRLILAKYSDWPSWILASEYLYYYFLKNDVEIYLWDKSLLHGKIATVDGEWSTLGSFNLNYTSYTGNLDMNIDVFSNRFSIDLEKEIDLLIETGCEKVDTQKFRNIFSLPKRFFYYLLLSFISNFSLAFIYQEDKKDYSTGKVTAVVHLVLAAIFLMIGVIGLVVPGIMGLPFLFLSFFIFSRQIILNKKKDF